MGSYYDTKNLGQKNGNAKVTADDVNRLRQMARDGASYEALSAVFPLSCSAIRMIEKRITWKHLPDPWAEPKEQLVADRYDCHRGERNGNAKVTPEQVSQIRQMCRDGVSRQKICEQFNVSKSAVSLMYTRRTWREIPDPWDAP